MDNEVKQEINNGLVKLIKAVFTPTNWAGVGFVLAGAYLYHTNKPNEAMACFTAGGGFLGINNKLGNGKL